MAGTPRPALPNRSATSPTPPSARHSSERSDNLRALIAAPPRTRPSRKPPDAYAGGRAQARARSRTNFGSLCSEEPAKRILDRLLEGTRRVPELASRPAVVDAEA